MQDYLLFFVILYGISWYHELGVTALPGQGCDSFFCPDLDELWRFPGVLIDQFKGPPPAPPTTDDRTIYPQAPPPATKPDFELNILAPKPGPEECKAFANNADDSHNQASSWDDSLPGDSQSTNLRPCAEAVGQIIWPRGCGNTEQNERTAAILSGMDGRYESSTDPLCNVRGGVAFWFARLTPDQIKALQADTLGVKAVMANPPYDFGKVNIKLSTTGGDGVPASHKKKRGGLRRKRNLDPMRVVEQYTKDESLRFLSTAPGQPFSTRYSYFSEAGAGVNVYMIETGLNVELSEFDDSNVEYLYALDARRTKDDDPLSATTGWEDTVALYQDGTCVGSKILGASYGVAKRVNLFVVKTKPHLASFINAITLIINHIRATSSSYGATRRVVVNIRGGYQPSHSMDEKDLLVLAEMRKLFEELVVRFQVIVVVAAGEKVEGSSSINSYPALFALDFDILTVGAVIASASSSASSGQGKKNGQVWPWSRGWGGAADNSLDAATMFAPGDGWCVNHDGLHEWTAGQGISTAIVSALAAYFLSLPRLRSSIDPRGENLPRAMKRFFQRIGYARYDQGPISVWNGIDSEDGQLEFDIWIQPKGGFPN